MKVRNNQLKTNSQSMPGSMDDSQSKRKKKNKKIPAAGLFFKPEQKPLADASGVPKGRLPLIHARKNDGRRLFLNECFENDENHPQRNAGGFAVANHGARPRWRLFGEERVSQRRGIGESHGRRKTIMYLKNSHAVTVNARNTPIIEIKEEKG